MNKNYFIVLGIVLFMVLPFLVKADTSTTFPVDEAGLAAYVKVDNIDSIGVDTVGNAFYSIEASSESYIIGTVKVENEVEPSYPHLYLGLDGWVVAYYLRTEEASRVMQWKNYVAGSITTNTLKDAIDSFSSQAGITYSTGLKYYDFEFPEANRLTIIAERSISRLNDFYVTVPGTLYEASYQILLTDTWGTCGGGTSAYCKSLTLKINEIVTFEKCVDGNYSYAKPFSFYDYYDLSIFTADITHYILFDSQCPQNTAYGTVLIYKN